MLSKLTTPSVGTPLARVNTSLGDEPTPCARQCDHDDRPNALSNWVAGQDQHRSIPAWRRDDTRSHPAASATQSDHSSAGPQSVISTPSRGSYQGSFAFIERRRGPPLAVTLGLQLVEVTA